MGIAFNLITVILLVIIVCPLLSTAFVRVGISFAKRIGFVRPFNAITNDKRVIALGGGVAFGTVIIATTILLWQLDYLPMRIPLTLSVAMMIGVADDVLQLRPQYKLACQIAVTVLYLLQCDLTPWSALLAMLVIVSAQNSWNLIDVMDGLAGLIAVFCFTGIAIVSMLSSPNSYMVALCGLVAAGSVAGFLVWNFTPARVFMGEAGSLILGTLFGALVIEALSIDILLAGAIVVIGSIPLFELVFLIVERSLKQIPFYRGSPDHFAIRLQNSGRSITAILKIVASIAFSLILAALAMIAKHDEIFYVIVILVVLCSSAVWIFRHLHSLPCGTISNE